MPPKKPPPPPDNPLLVKQAKAIGREGWFVRSVLPTPEEPIDPFTYTIGLYRSWDHPELIILGLSYEVSYDLLAAAVGQIKKGERFEDGREYDGLANVPIAFRQVTQKHREDMLLGAHRWNAWEEFPALQMVWPDTQGNFPWDERYERRLIQPLLSTDDGG